MRDFTLEAYKNYLLAIKASYSNILRFDAFLMADPMPGHFCLIRHDVDRKPRNALQMAKLENDLGIQSTYYFRAKPHVFHPDIIRHIEQLGHEIGYHYETLSDAHGNIPLAVEQFEKNLSKFQKITKIQTISMHGRPFSPYDNREIWRDPDNHRLLSEKYGILGEVYLDINYRDIAYINDTGRNWSSTKSNIRDRVNSLVSSDFIDGKALRHYLNTDPHPRLVLQIHPERWTHTMMGFLAQWFKDHLINTVKAIR